MSVKPVHAWQPAKTQDPSGGISSHSVDIGEMRHLVAETMVQTRGDFPIYRPGDIWKMLQGTVFQR